MSFISVFAKENFMTVVSDGLVVNINTGEELERNYKKFRKISENQFVAFGGNKGIAEMVAEEIGYQNHELDLHEVALNLRERLIQEVKPEKANILLAVGGIQGGEIICYSFSNDPNQELKTQVPKGDTIEYVFLSTDQAELGLIQQAQLLAQRYGHRSPTKTKKIQKELNDFVAQKDKTVNRVTFDLTIKK
jgi:hypothetical protein